MRALGLALLLCAGAATAEEDRPLHPLIGIAASKSDSGLSLGAELGMRESNILGRLTLDAGGSGPREFVFGSIRFGWVHDLAPWAALVTSVGYGFISYGFLLDTPTDRVGVVTPELGLLFGPRNGIGHVLISVTGLVPVTGLSHARDSSGQEIEPPRVLGSVLLAF